MTLFEVDQAANRIREEVADDANIIFGSAVDENLAGRIRVSVVATGIDTPVAQTADVGLPRSAGGGGPRLVSVAGGAPVLMPQMTPATATIAQPMPMASPGTQAGTVLQFDTAQQQEIAAETTALLEPAPAARHGSTLFTEPPREATAASTAPKTSMFNLFTAPPARANRPGNAAGRTDHGAGTRAYRAGAPGGRGRGADRLDIPAFLRRQSN